MIWPRVEFGSEVFWKKASVNEYLNWFDTGSVCSFVRRPDFRQAAIDLNSDPALELYRQGGMIMVEDLTDLRIQIWVEGSFFFCGSVVSDGSFTQCDSIQIRWR